MPRFTDNHGREWLVEVNVAAVKRVRALAGIDLLAVLDGTLLERFLTDPVALCDALYAVCKPEADERGVTDEAFGAAMAGDAIEQATGALLEAIVGFCPSPADRRNLSEILRRTRAVAERARQLAATRIESGEIEQAAERALGTLGTPSTSSPASSASTPPPSHSASSP